MGTTQQGRMMSISTPVGEDFLLINRLTGAEALSQLYQFDIELLHEEVEPGYEPTIISPKNMLGQAVAIAVLQRDDTKRFFHGIVNSFSQGNRDKNFSYYYLTVVPHVWVLTQRLQSRIFQHRTVPEILKIIFSGFDVTFELQGTFQPRNYCVQYCETDFDFASRLMEEEGIYYYFEHTDSKHSMIVANTSVSHRDCPSKSRIPWILEVEHEEDWLGSVRTWLTDYKLQSDKVTLWDSKFELPGKNLEEIKPSVVAVNGNNQLEVYEYPAGYARKYDGIDKGGGEQAGMLQHIFSDKIQTAQVRMQEIEARHNTINGTGYCCSMTAGFRFNLFNHPNKDFNALYTLTSVNHEIEQSPNYVSNEEVPDAYRNSFTCIPNKVPFRPPRKTAKPFVRGSQTATVAGPPGEEIFTDKYGRVKVQFHWDREGKYDSGSSCWIRVGQAWGGKKWGTVFIPRIGMEVIVDFLEGDPDQPIITGCVYNAETMPPYTLPDEKTKTTIKSYSSKGGGGFNEIRFEDKKGSEQVFIHGEKNLDVRVKNDSLEFLGNDRHLIVKNNQFEKVHKDKHSQVAGDRLEKVGGALSLTVGTDIDEKAGAKYALETGTEIHLKSGTSLTLETGTNLTLKVGGNFININSAGVFIKGTMVMLNSGGAAGSGSGASPDTPKDPKEADKAEPGQVIKLPPPRIPPPPPMFLSPAAQVMLDAAKSGIAFCEICSRESRE